MLFSLFFFFFFKQKTAYEMRISDWSSDVCSSDLHFVDHRKLPAFIHLEPHFRRVDHGGHGAPQFRHALLQRRGGADETNGGIDRIVKTVILVLEENMPAHFPGQRATRLDRKSTRLNSSH